MKEKLERIGRRIGVEDDGESVSSDERNTQLRAATALLTLVGFLMPWVTLDGYADAMSGSDLIAYAFLNPERASLFQVSWTGTLALLMMPIAALTATIYGFYRSLKGDPSLGAHLAAAAAPHHDVDNDWRHSEQRHSTRPRDAPARIRDSRDNNHPRRAVRGTAHGGG